MLFRSHISLLVLLDLCAAFDTVNHFLLLNQLRSTALSWFKSYLSNRTQLVVVSGSSSKQYSLKFGVPQGSCLGSLSFVIYSSELYQIITNHLPGVAIFADDSQLWISYKPDSAYESAVHNCTSDIKNWMLNPFSASQLSTTNFLYNTYKI